MLAAEASKVLRSKLDRLNMSGSKLHFFTNLPQMSHGFFPGGNGLYDGASSALRVPVRTVIVGSNFGCKSGFITAAGDLVLWDERSSATWRSLLITLREASIDPRQCFFTNAWPFLHEGDSNLTKGLLRTWLKDQALMKPCTDFLLETVSVLQATQLITLGLESAAFLAAIFPKQLGAWAGLRIAGLDVTPHTAVQIENRIVNCAALTHPCLPNARHRKPPYQHREGEARLLRVAMGTNS